MSKSQLREALERIYPDHVDECAVDHFKSARLINSFATMDAMPRELRECVHEFGLPIVTACRQVGVNNPAHIRELVHQIWTGPRNQYQKSTGSSATALGKLDWMLIQVGAGLDAKTLIRALASSGYLIVTREPSKQMVDASMDAVNHMGVVTKSQKHRNRLRAALDAGTRHLWPHLAEWLR